MYVRQSEYKKYVSGFEKRAHFAHFPKFRFKSRITSELQTNRPAQLNLRLEGDKVPQAGKIQFFLQNWQITQEQMDNGYSTGIQNTLCAGATSNMLTSVCTQPGAKSGNQTRDRISSEEGSYTGCPITGEGGLCEQCFLGSQERGKVETDPKFEGLEPVRNLRTLQDRGHPLCKGLPEHYM